VLRKLSQQRMGKTTGPEWVYLQRNDKKRVTVYINLHQLLDQDENVENSWPVVCTLRNFPLMHFA